MPRISMKTIRALNGTDLRQKIRETRADLVKLQTEGAKGTLRKESGNVKATKRDIARMMTRATELKNE